MELFMKQKWKIIAPDKEHRWLKKKMPWKMSHFFWGFHFTLWDGRLLPTVHTHAVLSPGTLKRNRKAARKGFWAIESKQLKFANKSYLGKKNAVSAGSKHLHLQEIFSPELNKLWMCMCRVLSSRTKELFFLYKWATIIIQKVLSNIVLIYSEIFIYKNTQAWYHSLIACILGWLRSC